MHDVAKGFVCAGSEKKFFFVGKSQILESQETCGLAWRVFRRGRKMLAIQVMWFPSVFIYRRLFFVSLKIATYYILGLIKAKTQEGREDGELGNIVTLKL